MYKFRIARGLFMEEKDVYRKIKESVEKIENSGESLEQFSTRTNFAGKHKLRIEDVKSSDFQSMKQIYAELSELEIADLLDYQNLIGRFDGDNSKAR